MDVRCETPSTVYVTYANGVLEDFPDATVRIVDGALFLFQGEKRVVIAAGQWKVCADHVD